MQMAGGDGLSVRTNDEWTTYKLDQRTAQWISAVEG